MIKIKESHLKELKKSCLTEETIERAGYYSTTYTYQNKEYPCWAIDCRNPFTGDLITSRYRFDLPFDPKRKYMQPNGSPQAVYFSQLISNSQWKTYSDDSSIPVVLVEGEKKADSMIQYLSDVCVIGLSGVCNWGKGGELNDLIQCFVIKGRQFNVVVDSDFKVNNKIKQAIYRLSEKLLRYGCKVDLTIAPGDSGSKSGIDDYLNSISEEERVLRLIKLMKNSERLTKTDLKKIASKVDKKVKQECRQKKPKVDNIDSKTFQITPGQIVLDRFFDGGDCYITLGNKLRKYNLDRGYYEEFNEDKVKNTIANFFDASFETAGYCKTQIIRDALEYVKIKTYIDPDLVNPPGLNTRSGYLELSYDSHGLPNFTLQGHSKEIYFTYCADVEFNENADDSILNKVLDEIIDEKQQKVLLRTIAAQFDTERVRTKINRIKALLLYGQGSNGKDTLGEWMYHLFSEGFTNVSLQDFRQADQGRSFGIFDLYRSRVNWSSENKVISIDNCETLKIAITGDSLKVEEKHKQGFSFKSKCVLLFNLNKAPKLESNQEAITSRYGILNFRNIFKLSPNPAKPHEKKADPRLKEDKAYIKKNILPALLNKLIQEFKSIFTEGIDYSINMELLQHIREESNHLHRFITARNLKECSPNQGITASAIHYEYLEWCIEEGLCVGDNDDKKNLKFFDQNNYDRIIRTPNEMGRRLREIFPDLEEFRTSSHRNLGLNFFSK